MTFRTSALFTFLLILASAGCRSTWPIEADLSAASPRFEMHGRTWGWPVRWPHISAFAIGADDESLWEIETIDQKGVPARQLAIVYGEVPEAFVQNHPPNNARPKPMVPGRSYFVAATGPNDEVFRTVFAVPIGPLGAPPESDWTPDAPRSKPMTGGGDQPPIPPKPAD